MFRTILNSLVAIVLSLVVAMIMIIATEGLSAIVHPFPPGVDIHDVEVCKSHVANYPQWILGAVVVCWSSTVYVSTWLATRLGPGRHAWHGLTAGALLFLAVAGNMWMLPYPAWFEAANYLMFPYAIWKAVRSAQRPRSATTGEPNVTTHTVDDTPPDHSVE